MNKISIASLASGECELSCGLRLLCPSTNKKAAPPDTGGAAEV
ncbi:hypothetical protein [Pontibacter kalidii]|nr:hypothetical protein [Pontibacter kalidii]